jgi:two-component system nitrogen regulation response regulator GlnG
MLPETEEYMSQLSWPGNVRQLENTCRWLTVMAPGQTIGIEDMPPELREDMQPQSPAADWQAGLRLAIEQRLGRGEDSILEKLNPDFERILIQAALNHTGGRKQDAARRLGWGRNTLTRKLKELGL